MSPPTYYLINHTRKEFCFFDHDISIFTVLDDTLNTHIHWKNTDNILISSELAGSCALLEHLTNVAEYTGLGIDYSGYSTE